MENTTRNDFLSLLDIARFGACVADVGGEIIYWNRGAEEITGISAADALGRRSHDVIRALASDMASSSPDPGEASSGEAPAVAEERAAGTMQLALVPVVLTDLADRNTLVAYLFDASSVSVASGSTGFAADALRAARRPSPDTAAGVSRLSPREEEILRHMAAGAQTEQIAEDLDISIHTVRNHIRGLRTKLGARTKLDAVVIAMREGLL